MSDHISLTILGALLDGELPPEQWAATRTHLAECQSCTSNALNQSLLKSATAKAGHRYSAPPDLKDRLTRIVRHDGPPAATGLLGAASRGWSGFSTFGWATSCALLVAFVGTFMVQNKARRDAIVTAETLAVATEVSDQHIAALASNAPPQVISSDRHTVKPWFQGKLPFSFNLPEDLASGTTLDGANFTYVQHRPAAHLLYSIGKHRASVYLEPRLAAETVKDRTVDQSGFHVIFFYTDNLQGVAVSDAEPSSLAKLVNKIAQAQSR